MHTIKEVSFSRRVLGLRDRSLNWFQTTENSVTWKPILIFEISRKEIIVCTIEMC